MDFKRIAAVGMAGVVLGAGSLFATTGSAVASTRRVARCAAPLVGNQVDDKWPGWANGRPANVDPTTASGVYMWHDGTGWHVRATHRGVAERTFSGRLETAGRFFGVGSVRLEGNDARHVSDDHHVITFRFDNHGAIDGFDFRTRCAPAITFSLRSDGQVLPAENVTIGLGGLKPATDPFTIAR